MFSRVLPAVLLIVFCLPAFAADLIPVEHFARLPKITGPVLSPDGERIAMILELDGEPVMLSSPADGSEDFALASYGEYRPRWYKWGSNRHLLLSFSFPYRRYGTETTETRLAVFDVEEKSLNNLVRFRTRNVKAGGDHIGQFQDQLVSLLPNDQSNVLLAMDMEEQNSPGVYKYPLTGGRGAKVLRHRSFVQSWHADATGTVRFGWGYRRNASGQDRDTIRMIFRSSADEDFELIAEYDPEDSSDGGFGFLGFTQDPNILVISDRNEWGRRAFYKFDTRTSEIVETILSHEVYDAGWAVFAEGEDRLVAAGYIADEPEIVFFDAKEKADHGGLERSFPNRNVRVLNRDRSQNKLVAMSESASSPPSYYYFDLIKPQFQDLGSAYPELEGLEISDTRPIEYESRDGFSVSGYLTIPKGADAKKLPVIVHPHGGPAARDWMTYDYWVQFFVSRGWAVLQMNFRGSDGMGTIWERLGRGEWGRAMQDDVTDGVQWAIEEGIADPSRICIVGASYGGYAALQGLVKTPHLYACGVSLNGVTDIGELIDDSRYYTGFHRWRQYWRQDDMGDVSPARNAKHIRAPVLVAYGTDDRIVDYDQSTKMISALRRRDKEVVKVKLEDGDHYLSKAANRLKFFQAMDAFLQKHLGLGQVPETTRVDAAGTE